MNINKFLALFPLVLLACTLTAYTTPTATETRTVPKTAQPAPTDLPVCIVTAFETLNLRETPGTNAAVIAILKHGDQLTILPGPAQGVWIYVKAQDRAGWINSNYCKGKNKP